MFLGENQLRLKSKKCKRNKILIAFVYFLFALLALKKSFYPNVSQTFFSVLHQKLDTEWPSCCLLHLGEISEKVIHASYDTLIYILKLACQILPWPLCSDVLKVHKKRFTPVISYKIAY